MSDARGALDAVGESGGGAGVPYRTGAAGRRRTDAGPGRALAAAYAVFALAAGARAIVQLATEPDRAPVAYGLSALAAVVYLVAVVALRRPGTRGVRVVAATCAVELVGVLAVGTLSLVDHGAFPDDSVWSRYGSGYGHVPVVLPVLGLWWAHAAGRTARTPVEA